MSHLKKAARGFISRFVSLFRATASVVAMLGLSFGSIPLTLTAADVTWDGEVSTIYGNATNWGGDIAPATIGDRAVFSGNNTDVNNNTTINLSGNTTVEQVRITAVGGNYTIGAGAIGTDTIIFSNQNNGGINIEMLAAVTGNQTINADLTTTDAGVSDVSFVNRHATLDLIINGEISRNNSVAGTGTQRIEFGALGASNDGTVVLNGNISNGGSTGVINLLVGGGSTLELNGIVDQQQGNDLRTIVLDSATINVNATGTLGNGQWDIRQGTVNLLNTTTNQESRSGINIGSTTQSAGGNATLNIGTGVTLDLFNNITYLASTAPGRANTGLVSGNGTIEFQSNRTIVVNDNTNVAGAELTISANLTSDTGNRTLTKTNGGTLLLAGGNIANGQIIVQGGTVQLLQDGALNTTLRSVTVQQSNNANPLVGLATQSFDLNGADAAINDLLLGGVNTILTGGNATFNVINSNTAAGGTLTIDDLQYREGTGVQLAFDNEVGTDFGTNQQVTGATSGATAFIVSTSRVGSAGNFTLRNVVGSFQDNEILTVTGTGTGTPVTAAGSNTTVAKLNGRATVSANLQIGQVGDSTWTIRDGSDAIDLDVSGDIGDDNNARDIIIVGEGTVRLSGNNTHSRTVLQNAMTIAGSGDIFGTGNITGAGAIAGNDLGMTATGAENARVTLQQRNTAGTGGTGDFNYNGDVVLDINGQDLIFHENLILGGTTTTNVAAANIANISVIDSLGTGKIILGGINGNSDTNNISYTAGTAGQLNKTATISADIQFVGSTTTFTANDGADDIDLDVTGDITSDLGGGRGFSKSGLGTLRLSGTNNVGGISTININAGTLSFASDSNIGNNDIQLGNNVTDGTLSYTGTGETIDTQFRIGDNNAGATRTAGGVILNNGTGALTFNNAAFNQARAGNITRTLTLGGTFTGGDNILTGAIIDNSGTDGKVAVTKTGAGTWTLNGDSSNTGNTTVSAGRLNVNGANTGNGDFTVAANASLGGEGSIAGNLTFSGNNTLFINPGTAGAFTTTGSLAVTTGNVTVDLANFAGAGNITALSFGSYANAANVSTDFIGTNAVFSARGGGSATAIISGNDVAFDLGFASRTWAGNGTVNPTFWVSGNTTDNNWVEGDNDFFNGDAVIFDNTAVVAGNTTAVLQGNVSASAITFQNHTAGFTVSSNSTADTLEIGSGGLNFFGDTALADDRINSELIGSGTITKGQATAGGATNVGQTTIAANNSNFTGVTVINKGDLTILDVNALGNDASNTITIDDQGDNGQLIINAQGTIVNDIVIANGGNNKVIRFDNGNNTQARALTIASNITIQETNGTLSFAAEGQRQAGDIGGSTSGNADATTHVITMSGLITSSAAGSDATVNKSDQGVLILTNAANDFTGRLDVSAGTVKVASIGNQGEASHAGASRAANGFDIRLGSGGVGGNEAQRLNTTGTLIYTGAGAESTDRQVRIGASGGTTVNGNGGGVIANNSSGNMSLNFTNAVFNNADTVIAARTGDRILTLAGTSTATNVISGNIINNAPSDGFVDETISVTVDTNGAWQLDAVNLYTGNTTVNAGSLYVNGSTAAGSAVTVGGGGFAATLGGSGTINGNVTVNALGNQNAGTAASLAATQTFGGNVTHTGGTSSITWDLIDNIANIGGGTTSDKFVVAGVVDFAAATSFILDFNGTGTEGAVDWAASFWDNNQTWDVITAAGGLNGSFGNLTLGSIAALADNNGTLFSAGRPGGTFALNNTVGTTVTLNYTAAIPEPGTYGIFGLGLALFGWTARRRRRKAAAEVVSD